MGSQNDELKMKMKEMEESMAKMQETVTKKTRKVEQLEIENGRLLNKMDKLNDKCSRMESESDK